MGYITIEIGGSFRQPGGVATSGQRTFSAQSHGHAHAVAEAIEYLSGEVMREAINKDHELHRIGHSPAAGFHRHQHIEQETP